MFWGSLPSSEKADTLLSASTQHKPRAPGVDRGSAALSTDYGTVFGFLGMLLRAVHTSLLAHARSRPC